MEEALSSQAFTSRLSVISRMLESLSALLWEFHSSQILACLAPLSSPLVSIETTVSLVIASTYFIHFFGAFTKLRKTTVSFVVSASLPAYLPVALEQLVSHSRDFHEIKCLQIFRNSFGKVLSLIKIWQD